jgi:hypothetical protein
MLPAMKRIWLTAIVALAVLGTALSWSQAPSPWLMEESGTSAGLRGIDSVDGKVAWASGTGGTVLRTIDGGAHWTQCAVPDGARDGATLDFRGVQAWDAQTAMVMASGPGVKSRLYKTRDGCRTWVLLFRNPDAPNGFFDSFWLNGSHGMLLGDPVGGRFAVFRTANGGKTWRRDPHKGLLLHDRSLAAFAASNSSIAVGNRLFARGFATGGKSGAFFFSLFYDPDEDGPRGILAHMAKRKADWKTSPIAVKAGSESSGVFSVAYRYPVTTGICEGCGFEENARFIAVGGDYTKPSESAGTAAWSADGGWTWTAAAKPPHGYRSAVEWSHALKAWIAAGTNGSDISRDDGITWAALDDGGWNALSLPFAVGPKGRIARLNEAASAGSEK